MNKLNAYIAAAVLGVFVVFGFYAVSRFEKVADKVIGTIAGATKELAGATTYSEGGGLVSSSVTSAIIVDNAIVNSDVNSAAAIAWSKISSTASVLSASLDSELVQNASVTVTSASLSTIATTPIQLVASSSGKIIELVSITGFRNFSSEGWQNWDEGLEVKIGRGSNATGLALGLPVTASFSLGFISQGGGVVKTTDVWTRSSPSYQTLYPINVTASVSQALWLTASSSHTIDGDTGAKFEILYRLLTF